MPDANSVATVAAWRQVDIELTAAAEHADPYCQVDVWADFVSETGEVLRRPAFWDGGRAWRIRFAPPAGSRHWEWATSASVGDSGLAGLRGVLTAVPGSTDDAFDEHGFWRMSRGGRSLEHTDGTPALMIADTAWALPWRATAEQVAVYARDRQTKGFNFLAPGCGWREALDFPGSRAVGMLGRILAGLPTTDMGPGWRDVLAARCLIVPDILFINYSATGAGFLPISDHSLPSAYRILDPRSGEVLHRGRLTGANEPLPDTGDGPRVYIMWDEPSRTAMDVTQEVTG